MPEPPVVTVLMATFNDAAFLPDAVRSVLTQTFTEFEFLIIDDGSTDGTSGYLRGLTDPRIRVVRNESNLGLTRSLKRGIELARGRFIARLDADDIALPRRLERQVRFLEEQTGVAILGSGCVLMDETGKSIALQRQPESDLAIRWTSLLANPFVHSTVMLRRQVLLKHELNYDAAYETSQDYDLWTRLLRYGKGANLPEALIRYRVRRGVTRQRRERQLEHARSIAARTIQTELRVCSLQPDQLRELLDLPYRELWPRRIPRPGLAHLIRLQCDLYSDFSAMYRSHPDLPMLRRRHFCQVVRFLCRAGFPPGWANIWALVLRREPLAPIWAGLEVLRALGRRISSLGPRMSWKNAVEHQ